MSSDIADVYARLRTETARLLAFDINALTPSQEVKVGMVAGLRLELDRLQVAQLRGEPIDPKQLVSISEMLETALRSAEFVNNGGLRTGAAREKLRALIERTLMAGAVDEAERLRVREREEAIQVQAALPTQGVPAAPPQPPPAANVVQLDPNNRRPPDHYLADYQRQNERWRGAAEFTVPSWPLR